MKEVKNMKWGKIVAFLLSISVLAVTLLADFRWN